jgi:hypothetical protein
LRYHRGSTGRARKIRRNAINASCGILRPYRRDRRVHALLRAPIHIDVRSLAGELPGNRKSNSCRRTCDERNFVCEFQVQGTLREKTVDFYDSEFAAKDSGRFRSCANTRASRRHRSETRSGTLPHLKWVRDSRPQMQNGHPWGGRSVLTRFEELRATARSSS